MVTSVGRSMLISLVISHIDSLCPSNDVIRVALYLCGFLPPNVTPSLIMRKTSDKSQ
jgi:hypothetical protein